jgi:UTP--glucose-1-phosphate uridylyltransferase
MAQVRKAIIPAAGSGTRQYPASSGVRKEFFVLADRDGFSKPLVQMAVEEALTAVEEVCIVCQPGAQGSFRRHFAAIPEEVRPRYDGKPWAYEWSEKLARMGERLCFVEQAEQEGLGHAVWCARDWVGDDRFLVLLGDHVYVSLSGVPCARQLVEAAGEGNATALVPVPIERVGRFGLARGRLRTPGGRLVEVEGFIEKPDAEVARDLCRVEGVPEGRYLAHFGMHVFTPAALEVLDRMIRGGRRQAGEFQLTGAQDEICGCEPYVGLVMEGLNFDTGTPTGLLEAQLALALAGELAPDAERIWARLTEALGRG